MTTRSNCHNWRRPGGWQVVEVYRRGGRLSLKSVKKLLRDAYKRLKASPNVQARAVVVVVVVVVVIADYSFHFV